MKKLFALIGILGLCASVYSGPDAPPADSPADTDPVYLLPKVTVSEKLKRREQEKWLTGIVGNFEIYSTASAAKTRDYVDKLYKFHQAFTYLFPVANAAAQQRITLVLCNNADRFNGLMPLLKQRTDRAMGSYTVTDDYRTILLINLDAASISEGLVKPLIQQNISSADPANEDGEDLTTYSTNDPSSALAWADSNQLIRREYLHLVFRQLPQPPPVWMEEGVTGYFSTLRISGQKLIFGQLDKQFLNFFNGRALLSMPQLFAITHLSPEYIQSVGSTFPSQSLAFVHLCMFSNKGKYQKALFALNDRAARGPITEPIFKEIFGMSYGKMETLIRSYVEGGAYKKVEAPKTIDFPPVPELELRDTTDAEGARIKGEVLRIVGRLDDANTELLSSYVGRHPEPSLNASLGLLRYETNKLPAARKHMEDAVAAKVDDVAAYTTLARLRLDEALQTANPDGTIKTAQLMSVLTPLFAARDLQLSHPKLYLLIAEAWEHSRVPAEAEHLAVIDEGVQKFPRNIELIYKDAALKVRSKFYDDARVLIEAGLKRSRDEASKTRFDKLKAALPEAPSVATDAQTTKPGT